MESSNKSLSKSASLIAEALLQKGLTFEVVELSASARTAQDAAQALGCEVAHIVKSLLFRTVHTNQAVLVLASGINRVNEKVLEQLLGEKVVKADADYAREITGFAIGGIPPMGHKQQIKNIFIDKDLLNYAKLWAAAGTPHAVFSFPSADIQKVTNGKIVSIT